MLVEHPRNFGAWLRLCIFVVAAGLLFPRTALALSDADLLLAISRDVDARCHVLVARERAFLRGLIEKRLGEDDLTAEDRILLSEPIEGSSEFDCNNPLVKKMFEFIQTHAR
ncbi:hypothetical protein [Bradyrhizobium canariense]|uniref:Uncharacterized protein n=1 Tax=Bradyrhizobium canariense TaxID=255045 RepID=A0A1H2AA31_9BRAD|nr:hypothetical protein [Bradyrhizobium canariense]SDT42346.1 hypothetical protein SAMN05444158_5974 [Bradyrhizobium canariense]